MRIFCIFGLIHNGKMTRLKYDTYTAQIAREVIFATPDDDKDDDHGRGGTCAPR